MFVTSALENKENIYIIFYNRIKHSLLNIKVKFKLLNSTTKFYCFVFYCSLVYFFSKKVYPNLSTIFYSIRIQEQKCVYNEILTTKIHIEKIRYLQKRKKIIV